MWSLAALCAIGPLLTGCGSNSKGQADDSGEGGTRPNILFISIDDLRPAMGYCGNTEIKTPDMGEIASASFTMMNTYSQTAAGAPSPASAGWG